MRRRDTPKRVTLPNGRTFFARYKRVSRGHLPANIRMNRTYRNQVARGRRRGQRGRGIVSTFKKIVSHPITQQLIRGAENLPDLYSKATSKIKHQKLKKALESEVAKKIVKKLSDKGKRVGRQRRTAITKTSTAAAAIPPATTQ